MILASTSVADIVLSLTAAGAYLVPAAAGERLGMPQRRLAAVVAWLLHASVLGWMLFGDDPRFGFAPALSVTAWLVLTVYAVEQEVFPQLRLRWGLAVLGAAAVLLAMVFPGTPRHPAASPLLPLHLALGIASYGLFAASVLHALVLRRAELAMRRATAPSVGLPLLTLERLTFRFATAGFVLLTLTLAAGTLFSEDIYGRAWRWDHKTVLSVLAWVVFAVLLLGRSRWGWRGRGAVRVLYGGSLLLLLAYVGSRFVLEVVLGRVA
jgi:ABC-type uncharacterized transport system permease subunit